MKTGSCDFFSPARIVSSLTEVSSPIVSKATYVLDVFLIVSSGVTSAFGTRNFVVA